MNDQVSLVQPNRTPQWSQQQNKPVQKQQTQSQFTTPTHVENAEYSFLLNTYKSAPPKKSTATSARRKAIAAKYVAPQNSSGKANRFNPSEILTRRRVRNIRETLTTPSTSGLEHDNQPKSSQDTIDLESTYYRQEIFDNCNIVNFAKPKKLHKCQPPDIHLKIWKFGKTKDKIWIQTTSNETKTDWIANTGSPTSFINKEEAELFPRKFRNSSWIAPEKSFPKYRCLNEKETLGAIRLNIKSGRWETKDNKILVIKTQTVNLMGKDVLSKRDFIIFQRQDGNYNHIQWDTPFHLRIIEKFPHLCTRLGSTENYIAKSTKNRTFTRPSTRDPEFPYT